MLIYFNISQSIRISIFIKKLKCEMIELKMIELNMYKLL